MRTSGGRPLDYQILAKGCRLHLVKKIQERSGIWKNNDFVISQQLDLLKERHSDPELLHFCEWKPDHRASFCDAKGHARYTPEICSPTKAL
jgi:hypothetical protein